ncbi:hypothetical protein CNEO4_720029 [Clostridium neonatale]|nr:hypothetical protein CNEO3_370018 [Clostridium neonatale]CAI3665338.1 hypothetical protein CNEO4_730018 [Clostridium neonatale]CAI3686439.1 hypothetical protein CNEO3_50019 [Clostridium neonatale]CAI3688228.1 hypothetical protein CNEO4_740027 [Clostridium neonatale]CAI3698805.1 hypothetical protein CNEO4_720029 [Clostridium neonatale]
MFRKNYCIKRMGFDKMKNSDYNYTTAQSISKKLRFISIFILI